MKALVTGSTGFIGSQLVEKLLARDYKVSCLIRKSTKLEYVNDLPVEFVKADYGNPDSLRSAVEGADYVFHVGGVTKAKDKRVYFLGNHQTTKNLLDAVRKYNPGVKRFVLASSLTAVGPGTGMEPVDENTPYHPITTYGRSKMEAEKECLAHVQALPITIIRPPAVYGPRDKDVFEFFNSINKHFLPLSGFRRKILSFVHSYDLVDGIIAAAEHPKAAGQIYFISNEGVYDWEMLGDIAKKILHKWVIKARIPHFLLYAVAGISEFAARMQGKPALMNIEKARDGVQSNWLCSPKKAYDELGFRTKLSLEEGVAITLEWYRKNGWMK
ncbi:MAG: NAD-dependent epimerase/dehydratase family protein [Bacteroidetes bacterium]|nr:NAD-dependent epimerase/dehydratase family protein [Bacteroidota bacterium]